MISTAEIDLTRRPELWHCRACGTRFVNNILTQDDAIRLYRASDSTGRWSTRPFEELKTAEVTSALANLARSEAELLDVGCNAGELLDFMASKGCRTTGADLSTATRGALEAKGHRWLPDLEAAPANGFDIITAFDLVEHVYDLPGFLSACRARLRFGGHLVLLTGDASSISARLAGSSWWYARFPEHIVFPSKAYFEQRHDFRVVEWVRTFAARGYRHGPLARARALIRWAIRRGYDGLPGLDADHVLGILEAR